MLLLLPPYTPTKSFNRKRSATRNKKSKSKEHARLQFHNQSDVAKNRNKIYYPTL